MDWETFWSGMVWFMLGWLFYSISCLRQAIDRYIDDLESLVNKVKKLEGDTRKSKRLANDNRS